MRRPRVYARTPGCGCVGCSLPLLVLMVALGALPFALTFLVALSCKRGVS